MSRVRKPSGRACLVAFILLFLAALGPDRSPADAAPAAADPSAAVVKVYVAAVMPDAFAPWRPGWSFDVTGSGAVIEGRRILTNAHVVEGHTFVQVRFHGRPEKHPARVSFVSYVADLALLEMEDPERLAGITPLELGGLPGVQDEVAAFGFPTGGDTLSITRGVVTRVEHVSYVQSWERAPGDPDGRGHRPREQRGTAGAGRAAGREWRCRAPGPTRPSGVRSRSRSCGSSSGTSRTGRLDGVPSLAIRTQDPREPRPQAESRGAGRTRPASSSRRVSHGSPVEGTLEPGDVLTSFDGWDDRRRRDGRVPRSRAHGLPVRGRARGSVGETIAIRFLRRVAPRGPREADTRAWGRQLVPRLYDRPATTTSSAAWRFWR